MYRPCLIIALVALATIAHADTIVIADTEFADADWDLEIFWVLGDGGTVTAEQFIGGGNPGAFRQVINTVFDAPPYCSVGAFHRYLPGWYDPGVQGAIVSVDYLEDAIMIVGAGLGQGAAPAVRQDGIVYVIDRYTTPEQVWTRHQFTGLTAVDFHIHGYPDVHPDFSAAGAPLEFGFARFNSTYSGGYVIVGGIDNWTFTLHTEGPVATTSRTLTAVRALF